MSSSRAELTAKLAVAVIAAAGLAVPASASAREPAKQVCSQAILRDSPGGFTIGRLYSPTPVAVLSGSHGWSHVRVGGLRGWVRSRDLCKR